MFVDYVMKQSIKDSVFINLNGLLSEDALMLIVNDAFNRHPSKDIIFKHKTNKKYVPAKIPKALFEKADSIIGFGLYSNHAEVVKSFQGWTDSVVSSYHSYIENMNKV
jgi:hypothetical protein